MKTTYTATAADGQTFTRASVREFTHAAIVTVPYPESAGGPRTQVSFASSLDSAHKGAERHIPSGPTWGHLAGECVVEIVEVTA